MEVVVSLHDRRDLKLTQGLANRLGRSAHGTREGAANPDAPACSTKFETKTGGVALSMSNHSIFCSKFSLILPHDLFNKAHLKT